MQHRFTTRLSRTRSRVALAAATVTALALVAPAGAEDATSPWPQQGGTSTQTQQGEVAGPDDPGFKWRLRLDQVESESAPDGYHVSHRRYLQRPIVGPDGTLITGARREGVRGSDGHYSLLGIDPDDGTIAWEQTHMAGPSCRAAIDGQNRLWAGLERAEGIAAFDPATGVELPGTRFELSRSTPGMATCGLIDILLDDAGETLVFLPEGPNRVSLLQVVDVSGDSPESGWIADLDDDLRFDRLLSPAPRRGMVTDDAIILPVRTGEDEGAHNELVSLALDGSGETASVDLPSFEGPDGDLGDVQLLRTGDTLIAGVRIRPGGDGDGYLAAFDLEDDLEPLWIEQMRNRPGPSQLTLGDGVVHANDGAGYVNAYGIDDGQQRWVDLVVTELGGQRGYAAVSDAEGRLFTVTSARGRAESTGPIAFAGVSADGEIEWQFTREQLAQAADLGPDEDLYAHNRSDDLGPIDADGTLYLFNGNTIIAIDDSGGLGACELPFEDVDEERNVHAANICRLVEAEITAGTSDTTYGPGQSVTRQQMAAFLTRALDLPTREGSEFDDVDPDSPFAPYINALVDAEITAGVSDTEFAPGAQLDRQQMATFLMRALELEPISEHEFPGDSFDDVSSDNVHSGAIYAVAEAEITQGVAENRFAPNRVVLRDQMASFLMRSVDFLED
jgi:hypothetical protein